MKMSEEISFDIDQRILDTILQEFDVNRLIDNFAKNIENKKKEEIEDVAKKVFGEYGRNLMGSAIELGEKYSDKTHEVIEEVAEKTGVGPFPHVCQRFLEIFNMGTQHKALTVVVSNTSQLTHSVGPCVFLNAIKEKCGEDVAKLLTCKHIDLSALEALCDNLKLSVDVRMEVSIPNEGYCQFTALRKK
jgi:hypothetical protein